MKNEIAYWLKQIVEDDPLPCEIDVIVFKISFNGLYKYIELLGFEKEADFSQIAYMPLEAQGFKINELLFV